MCIRWLYRRLYVYDTMNDKKSLKKGPCNASINPADLATLAQTLGHRINAFGHPSCR